MWEVVLLGGRCEHIYVCWNGAVCVCLYVVDIHLRLCL